MSSTDVALPSTGRADLTQATAIQAARAVAEVEAMVIVAQRCPRDMNRARSEIKAECERMAMASKAFYSVPNRGKGTTVHLAREMARIVGNIEYGVHELRRDDLAGMSEIQAYAWDLQTNTRSTRTFQVPHQKMVGKVRTPLVDLGDVYLNNQNIGARAVRECINTVLPTSLVEDAADWCRKTLEHGEGKPIADRISDMVGVFARIGVTVPQLEVRLGRKREHWSPADVADAGIVFKSIDRGELLKDEAFPPIMVTISDLAPTPAADPQPVADLAASSAEEVTRAPVELSSDKPTAPRRPPATNTTAGGEYGDVVRTEADPTPAAGTPRMDGETPVQMITRLAKAHGVEGTDRLLAMCQQITGVEVVKMSEYPTPAVLRIKRHLEGLAEDVEFEFVGGQVPPGSTPAVATADDGLPPSQPPAPQRDVPADCESWTADRWQEFITSLGLRVVASANLLKRWAAELGHPGIGVGGIAGLGIAAELVARLQAEAAGAS